MFDLHGKVALVTGATAWLGRDMAEVFAEHGSAVIITSRNPDKAQRAVSEASAYVTGVNLAVDGGFSSWQ